MNKELAGALANIRIDAASLEPGDNEKLIKVGVALEEALPGDADTSGVSAVLMLCLQALQALYTGENESFSTVAGALNNALLAAEQAAAAPANKVSEALVSNASESLSRALGIEPASSVEAEETSEQPRNVSNLNEIASALVQVDAQETEELFRICSALKSLSSDTEAPEARKLLVKAAREVKKAADRKGGEESLTRAGELIDEVSRMTADEMDPVPAAPTVAPIRQEEKPKEKSEPLLDSSLAGEFVTESRELLEAAESSLLQLESSPDDTEAVNVVFRAFHTIKGTSAFLGLEQIAGLAHRAESLLVKIRDGQVKCVGRNADMALHSVDILKELLNGVESRMNGGSWDTPAGYNILVANLDAGGDDTAVPELPKVREQASSASSQQRVASSTETSVRVRTDRVDSLIDMVGELVIAHAMLGQDSDVKDGSNPELSRKVSHAEKIVRELQDLSMAMRMVPLRSSFQKIARLVRDVASKCGKQVEFLSEGEETEIDRNMVDLIADPLVHLVRNAVDHGIESAEVRSQNGKSPVGKVRLAAYHAAGDVVIELSDDGAGLNRRRIEEKAIEKGLIESTQGLSESQVYNLIFEPGFSTAAAVTDVSGRGVGLDVVRKNIDATRGRIEIRSEIGAGTTFTVRLPLTLAITDGMLIRIGSERYIIPTTSIFLSFSPTSSQLSTVSGQGEMVSLRGELMPIIRLHDLFGIEDGNENLTDGLLVIVADGRRRCALMVDELLGQHQVVAKSLGAGVGKVQGVAGGAILGDGCVGLILDTVEIIALARRSASALNRRRSGTDFAGKTSSRKGSRKEYDKVA